MVVGRRGGSGPGIVICIGTEAIERRGWVGGGTGLIVGWRKLEVEVVKRRQIGRGRSL